MDQQRAPGEEESPFDPLGGLTIEQLQAEARKFTDPGAKFRAAAAGAMRGSTSEGYGNMLSGYNEGYNKEKELEAKYLPIVQNIAVQRQKQAMLAMQQAKGMIDSSLSAMLIQPDSITSESVGQTLGALVKQGRVPEDLARRYYSSLPKDPAALRGYIHQQALATTDPYRAVKAPAVEKYGEGEVGYEVDPVTRQRKPIASGGAKSNDFSRALDDLMKMDPADPRRPMLKQYIDKLMTHPPQAQTIINPDKKFVDVMAGGLGEQALSQRARAESAVETIENARALEAVLKNPVFLGPVGQWNATLARVLGSDTKKLEATTVAIRMMAQSELDAAAQMKGQGAMSDAERALVKRVALGDPTLTVPEVRAAITAAKAQARRRIKSYNKTAATLSQVESVKSSGIAPLFAPVQDPYPDEDSGVIDGSKFLPKR
jgi:hypothetical protein